MHYLHPKASPGLCKHKNGLPFCGSICLYLFCAHISQSIECFTWNIAFVHLLHALALNFTPQPLISHLEVFCMKSHISHRSFLRITLKIVFQEGSLIRVVFPIALSIESHTSIIRFVLIFRTAKFDMFHVKHSFSLSIRAKKIYPLGNLFVPILSEVAYPVFMLSNRQTIISYILLITYCLLLAA